MSSLTESEAAFESRAGEVGLTSDEIDLLKGQGIRTLGRLAYAVSQPGTPAPETGLKALLTTAGGGDPTVGAISSVRRLTFEAQTLILSQLRQLAETGESGGQVELPAAERSDRLAKQKTRLTGLELTGELEVSHAAYNLVAQMLEHGQVVYLHPSRFGTRRSELLQEKPQKQLAFDKNLVSVKDVVKEAKCSVDNEYDMMQALTRRSLAFDLTGVCSFAEMQKWSRHLLHQVRAEAPPGYESVTLAQAIRADKEAFLRLAEWTADGLKRRADGTLPFEKGMERLYSDPSIQFHLLPLPGAKPLPKRPEKRVSSAAAGASDVEPKRLAKKPKGGNKGGGKSSKTRMPLPKGMFGKASETKSGERIC